MSELLKKPDPPKKPEPRAAGAATTCEDVFKVLPSSLDETAPSDGNIDPDEEKITFREALKEAKGTIRHSDMDFLDTKKDEIVKRDSKISVSEKAKMV